MWTKQPIEAKPTTACVGGSHMTSSVILQINTHDSTIPVGYGYLLERKTFHSKRPKKTQHFISHGNKKHLCVCNTHKECLQSLFRSHTSHSYTNTHSHTYVQIFTDAMPAVHIQICVWMCLYPTCVPKCARMHVRVSCKGNAIYMKGF